MYDNIGLKTTVDFAFNGYMIVALISATTGVWAEFHQRDHSDQTHSAGPVFKVDTPLKELKYLEKYGYLQNCTLYARKKRSLDFRSAIISDSEVVEGVPRHHTCSHADIRKAVMLMQAWFKLPQSGELDDVTVKQMNQRRCGNPEIIDEIDKDITIQDEKTSTDTNSDTSTSRIIHKRSVSHVDIIVQEGYPTDTHIEMLPDDANTNSELNKKRKSSKLYEILTKSAKQNKDDLYFIGVSPRRKKYLHTYMRKAIASDKITLSSAEKAVDQIKKLLHIPIRKKRSTLVEETQNGVKFKEQSIRWRLLTSSYSSYISEDDQRRILHLAFRMWSEVTPLRFIEDRTSDLKAINVEIGFGEGSHMDCNKPFDGQGGEVAHSWAGGDIHIDDSESFNIGFATGLNLLYVALHEIGHVLSLNHSTILNSIMYPSYGLNVQPASLELGKVDRTKVQAVYGVCTGRFSTVFDVLKQSSSGNWVYYTYFFRGNLFWMYENRYDRPRYGDPLESQYEWKGFPDAVDATVQVLFQNKTTRWLENTLYVFKGEDYYAFDIYTNRVRTGYPRKIKDGFPAKAGQTEGIPSNIDSVFYDWRNEHLYFIKGSWVWEYDITEDPGKQGCCVSKKAFSDVFPKNPDSTAPALTGEIDAAYFSFKYDKVFFFKNETVYKNSVYSWKSRVIENKVEEVGLWYNTWNDICDV